MENETKTINRIKPMFSTFFSVLFGDGIKKEISVEEMTEEDILKLLQKEDPRLYSSYLSLGEKKSVKARNKVVGTSCQDSTQELHKDRMGKPKKIKKEDIEQEK